MSLSRLTLLICFPIQVVITGAKKESDLSNALTKLYPVLVEFKKTHVASLPGISTPTQAPNYATGGSSGHSMEEV